MHKKINVLITGLGGPLGISILKALNFSSFKPRVIGTDIDPLSVGLYRVDKAYIVPSASENEEEYISSMKDISLREKPDILFLGSEGELNIFSKYKEYFEAKTGCFVLTSHFRIINIATDKWKLNQELKRKGIPVPDSVIPEEKEALKYFLKRNSYPMILKPRFGSGSKNNFIIKNEKELRFFIEYIPQPVLQEYLFPDNEEYTIGVFMEDANRCAGVIIMKRVLTSGLTYKAEVIENEEIEKVCRKASSALGIIGPCNIQLRKTREGPKIFEINPRFSSTTVMRAFYGFNEPEMAICKFVLGKNNIAPSIKKGVSLRYWDEIYIEKKVVEYLKLNKCTEKPHSIRLNNI